MKTVSVIIPTFNRAGIISETLDSVKTQVYQNWECIIVDDGSKDETETLIRSYCENDKRFHFFKRPSTLVKGANSCRNFGFEKAVGNYILWLDSDDLLTSDALVNIVSSFRDDVDAVVSKVIFTHLETGKILKESVIKSNNVIGDYLTGRIAFYISGPVWKKDYLNNKTLFDPLLSNLDDWDFNLRRIYENPNLLFLDHAHVKYRIHSNSLLHEIGKANMNEIASEFRARNRHMQILRTRDPKNYNVLVAFTFERYKYLLRESLGKNQKAKHLLFRQYVAMLSKHGKAATVIRTIFAYYLMSFFKKGYKLLS